MTAPHATPTGSWGTRHAGDAAGRTRQYVSFWLDNELLGVPVSCVQAVLNPLPISATPRARPEISGLMNLRGQVVTAVNLRRRMKLPDLAIGKRSMNVVVRHGGESISLLVDDVGEVIDVAGLPIESVPHTLDADWKSVMVGVVSLPERLFLILDMAALLTLE